MRVLAHPHYQASDKKMILEEETYKKFGHYPRDLKPKSNKKILAACDDCGKIREIEKDDYRAFCRLCATKGVKSYRWKGGRIKRECLYCERIFFIHPSEITRGWGKYCSRSCTAKARMHNAKSKKTKPECIFETICKENNLPFHYTGNGSLWIGMKRKKQLNPDFIEANGKKICIEVMGQYWHSPLLNRKLRDDATLAYRKRHYRRYKWQPIFIWEADLLREDAEAFVLYELKKHKIM